MVWRRRRVEHVSKTQGHTGSGKKKRRRVGRRLSGIAILLSYTHVGKQQKRKKRKEANSTETQETIFLPPCGLLTVGVAICC